MGAADTADETGGSDGHAVWSTGLPLGAARPTLVVAPLAVDHQVAGREALEVRLVAQSLNARPEYLSPSTRALKEVVKPPIAAAQALGLGLAPSLAYAGDDDALDDFVRASRAGVWVKGQHYEAVRAQTLHEALAAGRRIEALWGGPWHVERRESGQEVGVAFAARDGEMLDAAMMLQVDAH